MVLTLPNILTFGRILAIPVLIALFFVTAPWGAWAALAVYTAAAVTDWADGKIARARGQISPIGRMMDPIADKMLVGAVVLLVVAFGRVEGVHILPALAILLREFLVSGLREFLAGQGAAGLPVSPLAKWKTAVQMVALGALILADGGPVGAIAGPLGTAGLWLAAVLTVVTGWAYVVDGVRQAIEASRG
ncbi:MAG: CDP-diacylglycerol--glycerol-3-phosphate 3-phosphatidyltransferase [Azospirillaceae bacterium]